MGCKDVLYSLVPVSDHLEGLTVSNLKSIKLRITLTKDKPGIASA